MKLQEYSFREIEDRYLLLTDLALVRLAARQFLMEEPADALLAYCYVDHQMGLSLEFICFARQSEEGPVFYPAMMADPPMQVEYAAVKEMDVVLLDEKQVDLSAHGAVRAQHREEAQAWSLAAGPRALKEIDAHRAAEYPDDLLVVLAKDGCSPEGCWVRLEQVAEDGRLEGCLLMEPTQEFGVHLGGTVAVTVTRQGEETFCVVLL